MATLTTYNLDYFIDDVEKRFFPRHLIIGKDTNKLALKKAVYQAIKELNKLVFHPRIEEFICDSLTIDLSVLDMKGISVKRIMELIPATSYSAIFDIYRITLGRSTISSWNILRNQDDFIDFVLFTEFDNHLAKRYQNKDNDYFLSGNKIILGGNFTEIGRCLVFFLPKIKYDIDTIEWELYDSEEQFICDYLEGLVSYKEGRAQSEMNIMELNTNADTLLSEGKEKMEEVKAEYRRRGFTRIGKKF